MRARTCLTIAALALTSACGVSTSVVAGDASTPPADRSSPSGTPEGGDAGRVVRVVDGDTIHVVVDGRRLKIRLIGVDTPETVHPRVGVQCYGREASAFAKRMLDGKRVRLTYDVERLDRYGRTLAYVYAGDVFVNHELVARGYATVLTVPPNVAHADRFVAAQRAARAAERGLWGACAMGGAEADGD